MSVKDNSLKRHGILPMKPSYDVISVTIVSINWTIYPVSPTVQ